jgi:RHS repeat-associated protein
VRISFDTGTGNARLVQQDDYLPFGLEINYTSLNPKNEYLYNKKELQEETGIYDYGARGYDPVTGRFNAIDRMSEKYMIYSGYAYVLNNPMRFVDPSGMTIEDPENIVGGYKKKNQDNIDAINTILKGGGLSNDVTNILSTAKDNFTQALSEVSTLENSDQVYKVSSTTGAEGGTNYNWDTNKIDISVTNDLGNIGHELHHGFEYEEGKVSFARGKFGSLYDITDETESYRLQSFLQNSTALSNFLLPGSNITDEWVRNEGNSMNPKAYQKNAVPDGPIDINSTEGIKLKLQIIRQGAENVKPTEVFKGWQSYYQSNSLNK